MNYQKDVEQEAIDFLINHDEDVKESLKNGESWDRNDISWLDDSWHSAIVDKSYTPSDAVYILENCENEETDKGLYGGDNADWRDIISTLAAYSYSNDVWFEAEELYNELKEEFENQQSELEEKSNTEEKAETDSNERDIDDKAVNQVWNAFVNKYAPKFEPVTDPLEEYNLLTKWIEMGNKAGEFWNGNPLGDSYIDIRYDTGYGMPDVKDFVDFDHEVAHKLPNIVGKYKVDIEIRIDELKHCKTVA